MTPFRRTVRILPDSRATVTRYMDGAQVGLPVYFASWSEAVVYAHRRASGR